MSKLKVIIADMIQNLDELFKEYEVLYDWQYTVYDAFMEGCMSGEAEHIKFDREVDETEKELVCNKFSEIVSVVKLFKPVASFGGEGKGDQYWCVYEFVGHQGEVAYVKFYGWYQSYNGSEYSDYKFVTPQEKTVVVYE